MSEFKFKQFSVLQDQTAMKIGTDGVLLGAWSSVSHYPDTVLDIGAGTGIIALMLAQRCNANTIDAVELDENAYEQAVENFERSDWGDRLFCYHAPFEDFAVEMCEDEETYELIVSNPPFYTDDYKTDDEARNKARFTSSLSFEQLLTGVAKILADTGVFTTIIPFKEESNFVDTAATLGLYPQRICRVQGTANSEVKRSMLAFSFEEASPEITTLVIEKARHQYTEDYIALTKDFYLKM